MTNITDNISDTGLRLAKYSGDQIIENLGEDLIREVVAGIFCGENVRNLTENLTRMRLALSNGSMLHMFMKSYNNIDRFIDRIPEIVEKELASVRSANKKLYLEWLVGLTHKGIQNVLRDNKQDLNKYLKDYESTIKKASVDCSKKMGDIEGRITLPHLKCNIDWLFMIYLFAAIGTQTLAIRGSEKSMYGKLFEPLVLDALLQLLGFERISPEDKSKTQRVFWLSYRKDKRESDATLLYKPGVGVRFDIGFIGPGNPEISLDKVSRFEREMEHGRKKYYMSTIIIVDRIGKGSRIREMAKNINGDIVQMSMAYWIKDVCEILHNRIGFNHEILKLTDKDIKRYILKKIKEISFFRFKADAKY